MNDKIKANAVNAPALSKSYQNYDMQIKGK